VLDRYVVEAVERQLATSKETMREACMGLSAALGDVEGSEHPIVQLELAFYQLADTTHYLLKLLESESS
jgi:hypothetical protein